MLFQSKKLATSIALGAVALGAAISAPAAGVARASVRNAEVGPVVALMVAPGQLKRARLMRVEEPPPVAEPEAVSDPSSDVHLVRGAAMALVGAACLWLAARQRFLKSA